MLRPRTRQLEVSRLTHNKALHYLARAREYCVPPVKDCHTVPRIASRARTRAYWSEMPGGSGRTAIRRSLHPRELPRDGQVEGGRSCPPAASGRPASQRHGAAELSHTAGNSLARARARTGHETLVPHPRRIGLRLGVCAAVVNLAISARPSLCVPKTSSLVIT
jgi:hypothetical protein